MKRFRTISTSFIVVIAIVFGCNVYYLISLYNSIKNNVERDIMTALADADLDELWIRADRAKAGSKEVFETRTVESDTLRHGETTVYQGSEGDMVATTRHPDGTIETEGYVVKGKSSFTNIFIEAVGQQFHGLMDPYVPVDVVVMDSVLSKRLHDRHIYPEFIATEIVDSIGNVVVANQKKNDNRLDSFSYCYNPNSGLYYRVHMTPLIQHIFSEMAGIIVTIFILMTVFALAFWYLLHTISKMRTIEEMKDDFVNNMTHELKTPLTIAYSANDALLNYDTSNDPAKKETYLKIANRQLKRLGVLVENILAMSMERRRAIQLKYEEIQLYPFIKEIVSSHRMRNEKFISIEIETDDNITVVSDKSHLTNVLNNLIDNSIKYSKDNVRITIRYDALGITVSDNGIGIPQASIPFIFDKFYRVSHGNRQDIRGYGIGLYYVKNILEKMGCSISVTSKEDKGSTFTIKFGSYEK